VDIIDQAYQAFSELYSEHVLTLCLCRETAYEKVYVYEVGSDLEYLKRSARRLRAHYGPKSVRLRQLTFEHKQDHEEFLERAEFDRHKLDDYMSENDVDESGGYL